MRAGVWSASSPSYKEYHGGARTAGNGGCPRLIFCLPFKDDDDNHGDDDDRRNLSPSGSHYISNLQATTAGDGERLRRRTSRFLSPLPVLQSSGEDCGARAEGMSFVFIFSTLSG